MKKNILLLNKTEKSFWGTNHSLKVTDKRIFADKEFSFIYRISLGGQAISMVLIALQGVLKSGQYDLIIIGDSKIAVVYSFFKKVFKNNTRVIVDQLILPDNEDGFEKNKNKIRKWIFSSIDAFIVNSDIEKKIYSRKLGLPISHFYFLPIFVEDSWIDGKELSSKDFVFSGGGALRDYKTFFSAIVDLPYKFKVMAFEYALKGIEKPKNCRLMKASSVENYLKEIKKSKFVVVPLHSTSKAAGQTTVLQAMACRKAVITTSNRSLVDYVENGETCLLVDPYDSIQLKNAINLLYKDKKRRKKLADNGYKKIKENFLPDKYLINFQKIVLKVSS